MEKPGHLAVLLLLLCSLLRPFPPSEAISDEELNAAIHSLQSRGYHLFGNAITSSDVRFDILFSNDSFTLFAPTDSALFSLDMAFSASAYIGALRHHVALGRLPLPALRALIPGTSIPTLLSSRKIVVSYRDSVDLITANGVDVVLPGLFYGQNIAVHGLAGILTQHTVHPSETTPPKSRSHDSRYAPANSPDFSSRPPEPSVPAVRGKTKRVPVHVHPPMTHRSSAPVSEFAYPPVVHRVPISPSGSQELSPARAKAGDSSSIVIPSAMHPISSGISDCSSTTAPAAVSLGYGICRNAKNFCAPTREPTNEIIQS